MRRPSYEQIIDWKNRRGDTSRVATELVSQIQVLGKTAEAVADVSLVYTDFIPIRLVTIIEVFIRGIIAELVNSHETYFERGEKLAQGSKVDLAFAFHVNRRELTVGDFVAHAVSLSSIESVMRVMDTLIGSYPSKLKVSHPRWTEQEDDWPLNPIIDDFENMMASLARLYEIRHILTHELPVETVFDSTEISSLVDAAKVFVEATDWVVVEALHDSVPRTQLAMNTIASDDCRQEEAALARAISDIEALNCVNQETLGALQETWERFADLQASLVASQVEGGSMYPMVWASERAASLRERIAQLDRIKKDWMDT